MGLLRSECDMDKHSDVSSSNERYAGTDKQLECQLQYVLVTVCTCCAHLSLCGYMNVFKS